MCVVSAMASMRSEVFWARVVELDLEECIPQLKVKFLTTYAKFAFGSDYTPQQADAQVLTDKLLKPIAGENETLIPALRMLWWESWGAATADMKRAAGSSEGDAPRKLSAQAVETRRGLVTGRLVGMTITSELDVSDALITACVAMHDGNRLKYVPWEHCTTRCMEVVGVKRDETFTRDTATGYLKVAEATPDNRADLASDLKVDMALRRRGLALDMADLRTWEKHERLREELMSAWARRQPPGYAQVTVAQVRKADEAIFTIMAKLSGNGIKKAGGERPMDAAVEEALKHRDFNLALQPLPARGGAEGTPESSGRGLKRDLEGDAPGCNQRRKKSAAAKAAAAASAARPEDPEGRKGGGRGKGGTFTATKLPPPLRIEGAAAADVDGNPICFAFNLGGCPMGQPGGRCPKGRHVCVLRKCQQAAHGYSAAHGAIPVQ